MHTILLLTLSNVIMTFAWYGHLKFKALPLWQAILASWLLAFFEYSLMVPANRWGHGRFSAYQLKILQEVITLVVFVIFAHFYLREALHWRYVLSFGLVALAVWVAFRP
ncbi:MAG: DMT family protein [Microscillaceae bacterium]|nr:DMT family protein [Microscillaceae bacterium]